MSSLAEQLAAARAAAEENAGPRVLCRVLRLREAEPEAFEDLQLAIRTLPAKALAEHVEGLSAAVISRHRAGTCISCTKAGVQW